MTHAFNQYTKKLVRQAEKPSVRKMLAAFRDKAAQMDNQRVKEKNYSKGERER